MEAMLKISVRRACAVLASNIDVKIVGDDVQTCVSGSALVVAEALVAVLSVQEDALISVKAA